MKYILTKFLFKKYISKLKNIFKILNYSVLLIKVNYSLNNIEIDLQNYLNLFCYKVYLISS